MSREKMIPKAPAPDAPGKSEFQRTADLTRRLLHVPKSEIEKPRRQKKPKRRP